MGHTMSPVSPLEKLSDRDLHARLRGAIVGDRRSCVDILHLLSEVDRRRSHLGEGSPSLFAFCVQHLQMGEAEAYLRITAARTARRFPVILSLLECGDLHLTSVARLSPHLTEGNHVALLEAARNRPQRELQRLIAGFAPTPHRRPRIEAVVESAAADTEGPSTSLTIAFESDITKTQDQTRAEDARGLLDFEGPAREDAASAEPVLGESREPNEDHCPRPRQPTRYRLHVTISVAAMKKLETLSDLMRHQIPNGDPALILERALDNLLEVVGKRRLGLKRVRPVLRTEAPAGELPPDPRGAPPADVASRKHPARHSRTKRSRHIPSAVRRQVWKRDAGQCAFQAPDGRRCGTRGWLEYHHVVPFARGGPATVENIELRCRAHNQHEARLHFGNGADPRAREG